MWPEYVCQDLRDRAGVPGPRQLCPHRKHRLLWLYSYSSCHYSPQPPPPAVLLSNVELASQLGPRGPGLQPYQVPLLWAPKDVIRPQDSSSGHSRGSGAGAPQTRVATQETCAGSVGSLRHAGSAADGPRPHAVSRCREHPCSHLISGRIDGSEVCVTRKPLASRRKPRPLAAPGWPGNSPVLFWEA